MTAAPQRPLPMAWPARVAEQIDAWRRDGRTARACWLSLGGDPALDAVTFADCGNLMAVRASFFQAKGKVA